MQRGCAQEFDTVTSMGLLVTLVGWANRHSLVGSKRPPPGLSSCPASAESPGEVEQLANLGDESDDLNNFGFMRLTFPGS